MREAPRRIVGLRLWAQNSGVFLLGKKDEQKRAFHAGVPKGAADISGLVSPSGRRIEIELKSPKAKYTEEQKLFGEAIQNLGGIYVFFRMLSNDGDKELEPCINTIREAIEKRLARPDEAFRPGTKRSDSK